MKRTMLLAGLAITCALAAGCKDDNRDTPAADRPGAPGAPGAPAPMVTTTTTTTTTTTAAAVKDEDIPTRADFEEEAEREITPSNMDAELAKIEKDLAAETPTEGASPQPGTTLGTPPAR